jgi:tripartite-type tricarboxylate transporter receptor subunit TctC
MRIRWARPGRSPLVAACCAAALVLLGLENSYAVDYPTRPVHWVVGYPAGGTTDIIARLVGQWLSERLGQQFIIENKPGAGNNIGTQAVINAPPDGYTVRPMPSTPRFIRSCPSTFFAIPRPWAESCAYPT